MPFGLGGIGHTHKLDQKNAFNHISRAAIVETHARGPLQHLAWFEAIVSSPESGLEVNGNKCGTPAEGETQGDSKAS